MRQRQLLRRRGALRGQLTGGRWGALLVFVLAATVAGPARATYSVVAAEPTTGRAGGAGASCVGTLDVSIIYGVAPGRGAVHAQATFTAAGRDEAVRLLGLGVAPAEIIAALTNPSFDAQSAVRQYGIVDLQGRAAGFTGASTGPVATDVQDAAGGLVFSVQGNILTSAQVVESARAGFAATACDLPARLMAALVAGAQNGEGDNRCTGGGIPADSAFLRVDEAGGVVVHLSAVDTGPQSAVVALQQAFDDWRAVNPCPVVRPDAGTGPDAGAGGGEPRGCGCRTGAGDGVPLVLILGVLLALHRRRRPDATRRAPPGQDGVQAGVDGRARGCYGSLDDARARTADSVPLR